MSERAEVSYRETEYGLRGEDGTVRNLAVGPNEAKCYADSGLDVVHRHKTVYYPDVSEWAAMPKPQPPTTRDPAACCGAGGDC